MTRMEKNRAEPATCAIAAAGAGGASLAPGRPGCQARQAWGGTGCRLLGTPPRSSGGRLTARRRLSTLGRMARTVLVTGASGFLGTALLRSRPPGLRLTAAGRRLPPGLSRDDWEPMDLAAASALGPAMKRFRPTAILHAAATQRDEELESVVVEGTRQAVRAAQDAGAFLLHVSTDMVFDGEAAPYHEASPHTPNTAYGRAKARAEDVVRETAGPALVVRTSLLFEPATSDPRTAALLDRLARGEPVILFTDEVRCPAHVGDLAAALWRTLEDALTGRSPLPPVAHLVGPEPMTRYEFGVALLGALGRETAGVRAGTIAESGLARPRDLTLVARATPAAWRAPIRSAREVLAPP